MHTKIAVIGTHGTGKTTLAKALSRALGIPLIREQARNHHSVEHATSKEYINIQKQILYEQIAAERKHINFVSDRSTIDNLAYWIHGCAPIVDPDENKTYIKTALRNTKNYTDIFLLVPEFYPRADGFRNTNIIYQLQIAETTNTILHLHQIPYHAITGSVNERLRCALDMLHKCSNQTIKKYMTTEERQ